MKLKNKYCVLVLLFPLLLLFTATFTSCDPHRAGSVIKGPGAKQRYHHKPASGKAPRKNKY